MQYTTDIIVHIDFATDWRPPVRTRTPLPARWRFLPDIQDIGVSQKWFALAHDTSAWRGVPVPGVWDSLDESLRNFEGVSWYAVEFAAPALAQGRRAVLRFGRVFYKATVWLNGRMAGEHDNGYAPFSLDITRLVKARNRLIVRVDNQYHPPRLPGGGIVEWVQYGGIWEPVVLDIMEACSLDSVRIDARPEAAGGARVRCSVWMTNTGRSRFRGRVMIAFPGGARPAKVAVEIAPGATRTVEHACVCPGVKPWTPQTPHRYPVSVELRQTARVLDSFSERIGARTVEVRNRRILLNGQPLYVKGVNRYDEYGGYGVNPPARLLEREFRMLKAAGVNLLRCHYPPLPSVLDMCDKHGILLMQELPLNWWGASWWKGRRRAQSDDVLGPVRDTLRALVERDYNRPCLAIWSIANESKTDSPVGARVVRELIAEVRMLDPSRLVTFVVSQHCESHTMFALADIVTVNIYFGLHFGRRATRIGELDRLVQAPSERLLRAQSRHYPDKAFMVGEFGTCGLAGMRGDAPYTEDMQAAYLRSVWRAIRAVPACCGGIVWSWEDYRHRRDFVQYAPYGPYGVVTIDRKPKLAYQALVSMFTGRTA